MLLNNRRGNTEVDVVCNTFKRTAEDAGMDNGIDDSQSEQPLKR